MGYRHISYNDRFKIQVLFSEGYSFKQIGLKINKHPTTVSRELKRNSAGGRYTPEVAQRLYCGRKALNAKRFFDNAYHRNLVRLLLTFLLSPEQIAGRLKMFGIRVSYETIYKWIYAEFNKGVNFLQYLRINKKRNKRGGKNQKRALAACKKSIHDRPPEVANKTRIGDWEGDTVEGKKGSGFIATFVERKSLFLTAAKMHTKSGESFLDATLKALGCMKDVKTITLDNGCEMSRFKDIEKELICDIYFADPGNPGQRGLNENTNGLLRQFFPKGTDFNKIPEDEIANAVYILNNRPRKSLGFLTPVEYLEGIMPKQISTALRL
jgi:IS30 family transposase